MVYRSIHLKSGTKILKSPLLGEQTRNFREKNTPNNNFSTVLPIFTINIPIDSECGIFTKVSNLTPGSNWEFFSEEITPKFTFQSMNRFPQKVYRLIQLDKRKHTETSKVLQNSLQGSNRGIFVKKSS
jgi:hypothetical protein